MIWDDLQTNHPGILKVENISNAPELISWFDCSDGDLVSQPWTWVCRSASETAIGCAHRIMTLKWTNLEFNETYSLQNTWVTQVKSQVIRCDSGVAFWVRRWRFPKRFLDNDCQPYQVFSIILSKNEILLLNRTVSKDWWFIFIKLTATLWEKTYQKH